MEMLKKLKEEAQSAFEGLKEKTGKALLEAAGCKVLASATDPAVKKVIEDKGWPTDKVVLVGPPSDSVVRPAMYVVMRGLHTEGKVAMVPVDFMKDIGTDWYGTLTGGKREVPCMIIDGFVVGESIPMLKVLMHKFPDPKEAALIPSGLRLIEQALTVKWNVDHLLKHFGFCKMAAGAKPYRYKGALSGQGLQWVKEELKPIHEMFTEYEKILKDSKFLCGQELTAADCAAVSSIGSMYHITELPVPTMYPNCWRYYNEVKKIYMDRSDWPEISKTGCGFFTAFEQFETFVKVFNADRRAFACCSGREALSNPTYWQGVNDTV